MPASRPFFVPSISLGFVLGLACAQTPAPSGNGSSGVGDNGGRAGSAGPNRGPTSTPGVPGAQPGGGSGGAGGSAGASTGPVSSPSSPGAGGAASAGARPPDGGTPAAPSPANDGGLSAAPAGDGGAVVNHGCRLVASPTGFIDVRSNNANVQGAVFTYASKDSMIAPLTSAGAGFTSAGDGKLCVKGSAAKVLNMDYASYFGAAMGIDLCSDAATRKKYTLATCPGGSKLVGLRFQVTGTTIPGELRATFNEAGRTTNGYVLVGQGMNEALFANGKVLYDTKQPPTTVANIDSLHFTIPTNVMQPVAFDFCIEKIELVTKGGTCDMGASTLGMMMPAAGNVGGLAGTLPTVVAAADLSSGYDAWKATYVRSCPGKGAYVTNPQDGGSAYSEGIGYGMLLAVANGDQATFDALWSFYKANTDGNGLMHWKVQGCGGVTGQNSATDGDIDVAMALVQASCKFGMAYGAPAKDLIGKIKSREIVLVGGVQVVRPGDAFNDPTCINPSYFAPGFFRAFGRFTGDSAFWDRVASDTYVHLGKVAHPTTGLVPNWAHTDGKAPQGECGRPDARLFGYDAARTPWRLAADYRFWGTASAKALLEKHVAFAKTKGIDAIGDKYNLDGSVVNGFHTPVTTGAFATATVASDAATANMFYQALKANTVNEYFPATLKLLYLAFGAGKLDRCVM
jgi:endo-1,4-beta-D-glucanase Y